LTITMIYSKFQISNFKFRSRVGMPLATAIGVLVCLFVVWISGRSGRGQEVIGDTPPPDLLRSAPFDRITLSDNKVYLVEPVSPRPLPPIDKSKSRKKLSKKGSKPPPEGNIGLPGEKSKFVNPDDEKTDDREEEVTVHLFKGDIRDFKVKRSQIKQIEYFENMLLAEMDRRLLARDYLRAFECALRVQTRNPGWPGLDDHVNRLLFAEGSEALMSSDGERGMRLLRELHARKPDFPGLLDRLGESYGSKIARAFDLGLFAKGRKILHELEQLAPNHPSVTEARDRFIARARGLVQEASKRAGVERLDALAEALRVWPELEGAGALYNAAFAAEPTLDVAVTDVPRPPGPWVHSPADARVARLLYLPLLATDDEEAMKGERPGQVAEAVESSDLGRKLSIRVRPRIAWSDGSREVSAFDVARDLAERAEPVSPRYNARWADLLERVETSEDRTVAIVLTRSFLTPGAWFLGPLGPANAGRDGRLAVSDGSRQLVCDGPYRLLSSGPQRVQFHTPAGTGALKVRRIREDRSTSGKAAVGALIRGEVSLVEHLPSNAVAGLAALREIKVGHYSSPALHRLALDGRNPALRNRSLRRGLSYAIDRLGLLQDTVLGHPPDADSLVSDGPFARGSYADAADVKPFGYDPLLARMLVAAARKELGGGPIKLTLEYPTLSEAEAVVPKLVEAFRLIGLEIVATARPESDLESELRAGRKFDLAYRVSRCNDPLIEAGPLLCPGYDAPPSADSLASVASPRILQLLMQLERAPEIPSARGILLAIDRESRDELPVIPLWQARDHYGWRTRLKGINEVSDNLYQGIETWTIEPWYARDSW
jgi:peptide/nickel transport system substrate-binding protein